MAIEDRILSVLTKIEILDGESWSHEYETVTYDTVRFRWVCWLADTTLDAPYARQEPQHGRWWYVQDSDDDSHLLRTAWLAYQTFMHHEMLERFRYKGQLVFNPHQEI